MAKLSASCMGPDCRRNQGRIGLHRHKKFGKVFCSQKCVGDFAAIRVQEPNWLYQLVGSFLKLLEERFNRQPAAKPSYRS